MSYYNSKTPKLNDIVFVKIKDFSNSGTYCNLIEFCNIEGFILNTELDRRVFDPKKIFKIGLIYPMVVLSTDNGIDLSYRKVKQNEREKLLEKFGYITKIFQFSKDFMKSSGLSEDIILPATMWKFFSENRLENPQKIYIGILKNPSKFTEHIIDNYLEESKTFSTELESRITISHMLVQQFFELIVFDSDAITKLRDMLKYDVPNTEVKYYASPKYQFIVTADNQEECDKKINDFINVMNEKAKSCHCSFRLTDRNIIREQEYFIKLK